MKNWLKQTSTVGGILSLVITGLQAYQSGGDVLTAVLAVLSSALLLVRDGQFLAGLCALVFVGSMSACATFPVSQNAQLEAAAIVACSLMEQAGCFEDAEIQGAFPSISADTCTDTVLYLGEAAEIAAAGGDPTQTACAVLDRLDLDGFDPAKLAGLEKGSCAQVARALGVK